MKWNAKLNIRSKAVGTTNDFGNAADTEKSARIGFKRTNELKIGQGSRVGLHQAMTQS